MITKKSSKERILETAFDLFTSSSYDKISIEEIVKKVGVSKGGLFHYFDSKYDLAKEALFHAVKNMWNEPMEKLESIKVPNKKIKEFINFSVDMSIKNPKTIKFFIDIHEESLKRGDEGEEWLEFFIQYVEVLGNMFAECKIPNPQIKAMILLVSLDAVGFEAAHFPELKEGWDKELLKKEFYEIFVGNYVK